jgi:hypothetical protein
MKRDANLNVETDEEIAYYKQLVCDRALVLKRSGEPFNSGSQSNIVIGTVFDEQLNKLAFLFAHDNSIVECWRCIPLRDVEWEY